MKKVNKKAKRLIIFQKKLTFSQAGKQLGISPPAAFKAFKQLIKHGYISEKRNLTEKGRKEVNKFLVLSRGALTNRTRLHKFQFYFKILKKPRDYDYRKDLQLEDYTVINLKNTTIIEAPFKGARIRFTSSKVLVFPEDIIGATPEDCTLASMKVISTMKNSIEEQFKLTLSPQAFITEQEYARLNDPIAKRFIKNKKGLYLTDPRDKKPRIIVDFSKRVPELEAVHSRISPADAERIAKHMKDWAMKDTPLISTVNGRFKRTDRLIKKLEAYIAMQSEFNFLVTENMAQIERRFKKYEM